MNNIYIFKEELRIFLSEKYLNKLRVDISQGKITNYGQNQTFMHKIAYLWQFQGYFVD